MTSRLYNANRLRMDDQAWLLSPADKPPLVPTSFDDEFSDASIDPKWSWINQGAATIVEGLGYTTLFVPKTVVTGFRIRQETASLGTDWTLTAKLGTLYRLNGFNFAHLGIFVMNNASQKFLRLGFSEQNTVPIYFGVDRWTAPSTFSGQPINVPFNGIGTLHTFYLRMQCISSTIRFYWSQNGIIWKEPAPTTTETLAAWVSSVDRIGFCVDNETATDDISLLLNWIRVSLP